MPNFRSFGEYLENVNNSTLEKGILFLKDIYTYEESDYNKQGAKQIVKNLSYYFADKAMQAYLSDTTCYFADDWLEAASSVAYRVADAMLKARSK